MKETIGTTRADFLAEMPDMADWVEKMEGMFGPLEAITNLKLDGDRWIGGARFERVWHWMFINPANGEKDEVTYLNLTPEAMCAVIAIRDRLASKEQCAADWERLIGSLRKAEPENAKAEEVTENV